jgi:hypothetical protein
MHAGSGVIWGIPVYVWIWPLTSFTALQKCGRYRAISGQTAPSGLTGSAAFDPYVTARLRWAPPTVCHVVAAKRLAVLPQRRRQELAHLGRAGRSRLCPLSEVLLPRRLLVSEAAYDP